jgi:hypothetical protein
MHPKNTKKMKKTHRNCKNDTKMPKMIDRG